MPYARSSTGYPLELREAVEQVLSTNLTHAIACDDERLARSLRSRFNQYRAACKRDLDHPPKFWSDAQIADHKRFVAEMEGVEFVVVGNEFLIRPRDKSPVAALLRTARAVEPPAARLGSEGDAAARSLEAVLGKVKGEQK